MTVHESTRRHPGTAGAVPEAAPASGAAVDSALVDGALVDGVLTEGVPVDPGVPVDTTSLPVLPTNGATGPDATSPDRGRLGRGILLSLLSPISNQVGAGIGALAFPAIGPVGVVSVRQLVMALLMVPLGRPRFRRFTRSDWALVVALGLALATMNITLYYSVSRIGLGLAITLEFLGPLGLAIATSRRFVDLAGGLLAGVGVVVLVHPGPTMDLLGVGSGLIAAVMWAAYVLLNRRIGQRFTGYEGAGAASLVSVLIWLPVGALWFVAHPPPPWAIGFALICGVLSSVVPLAVDQFALRHVPTGVFSTLQSMHPVWAAVVGLIVLHEMLSAGEWLGIALVVLGNLLVTSTSLLRPRFPS